jgi:hypothetical protein
VDFPERCAEKFFCAVDLATTKSISPTAYVDRESVEACRRCSIELLLIVTKNQASYLTVHWKGP